jgi:long-chain acyl-CoA synthetase
MPRPFPWEKIYPPELDWGAPIPRFTMGDLIDDAVAAHGPKTALVFREREISYARLGAMVGGFSRVMTELGIGPGSTVALYLPNTPWHPVAFFGALKTGARCVHLSPLDAERTLGHKISDSGARVLVTTDLAPLLGMALKLLDAGRVERIYIGEDATWGEAGGERMPIPERADVVRLDAGLADLAAPADIPSVDPNDVALLQYTGGTTGLPKGAMLTHANLAAAVGQYKAWVTGWGMSTAGEERVLCVLPLFHIYALTTILLRHLQEGNEILLRQRFDAAQTLDDIEQRRLTAFPGVPTMWIAIAGIPGLEKRDLSSLRYAASGGAPLPVEVAHRLEALIGLTLRGGWGMTETSPAGTNLPLRGPVKHGSIGIPLPGVELDIVSLDDPTRVLPPGEVGELRVRGPNVTKGYWNRPDENATAFVGDRFLTGDVGRMDEDGWFFIVERKKDMIISGGFNVYPQMIEQAIYEHPAVAECVVVGIPDAYRGEAAKAFVTLRPGATAPSLDGLRDFLADKLGRHEMPTALEIRESLPRTPVGKLSRVELRDAERDRAGAGAPSETSENRS